MNETVGTRAHRALGRHFAEMVAAMVVGMLVLEPVRMGLASALDAPELGGEAACMAMATEMSIAMALWMRIRHHGWGETLQMCLAMYVSFVVLFPLLWVGLLDAGVVLLVGHLLMLIAMWILIRRHDAKDRRPEDWLSQVPGDTRDAACVDLQVGEGDAR